MLFRSVPALTRRVNGYTIVSLLDPAKLLPDDAKGARFYLARADGLVLATAPATAGPVGGDVRALFGEHANAGVTGFIGIDDAKKPVAIGVASVATGDLRMLSAGVARSPLAEMLRALVRNILLAAAPVLAVGALLMLHPGCGCNCSPPGFFPTPIRPRFIV